MSDLLIDQNAWTLVGKARRRGNHLAVETATAAVIAVHMLQAQKDNIRQGFYQPLTARERSLLRIILHVHSLTTGIDHRQELRLLQGLDPDARRVSEPRHHARDPSPGSSYRRQAARVGAEG